MPSEIIEFTVLGEPASKANSRQLVYARGRPLFIHSQKATGYLRTFAAQCPDLSLRSPAAAMPGHRQVSGLMQGYLGVDIQIFYASRRPDLDESLILDAMQGKIYDNDRQIREKHITWGLDPTRPRTVIRVYPILIDGCRGIRARPGRARANLATGDGDGIKRHRQRKAKAPSRRSAVGAVA